MLLFLTEVGAAFGHWIQRTQGDFAVCSPSAALLPAGRSHVLLRTSWAPWKHARH